MTEEVYQAYGRHQARERAARQALDARYAAAVGWLESNFNSLEHWRRFVQHVEALIARFREEERQAPPYPESALLRQVLTAIAHGEHREEDQRTGHEAP